MTKKLNRREFIKISGAGAGGAVAAASMFNFLGDSLDAGDLMAAGNNISRTATYCDVCFWKCAGWVYQKDNKPWKIIGNDIDSHSYGRLCTRGTGGLGNYMDEDRLQTPLIRTNDRGKQSFRKATWDEAFKYIAEKMDAIKKEHGPECVALFSHGSGGTFFKTLLKAYGSENISAP